MEYIGNYKGYKVYEVKNTVEAKNADDKIYASPSPVGFDLFLYGEYVGWCDAAYRVQGFEVPDAVAEKVREYRNPKPKLVVEVLEEPKRAVEKKEVKVESSDDFWNKIENEVKNILETKVSY